jgi:hypothetical protein
MLPPSSRIVILSITRAKPFFPLSLHTSIFDPVGRSPSQYVKLDLASLITLNAVISRSIFPAYELLFSIPEVRRDLRIRESNHEHFLRPIILGINTSCSRTIIIWAEMYSLVVKSKLLANLNGRLCPISTQLSSNRANSTCFLSVEKR